MDKGVILLAGRISSAARWPDLGETGDAEVPQALEHLRWFSAGKQQTAEGSLRQKGAPGGVITPWDSV